VNIKTLIASAIIALSGTAVMAQDIAVGQEGRGYEKRGLAVVEQLRGGWGVRNFAGSEDIARSVCDDAETPIGIAQIDAIYVMEQEGCTLRTIGTYPTLEYAIILFPPGGDNELSDLGAGDSVLVDEIGSGTALFWQNIVNIENVHGNGSDWINATPVYDNIVFAESMADTGEIQAVVLVGNPNSQEVWDLINAGWDLGQFDDKDINDLQYRGNSLYEKETVKVDPPGMFNGDSEQAFVVKSYFIANSQNADRQDLARIARIVKTLQ
jgi:hypothetical protein